MVTSLEEATEVIATQQAQIVALTEAHQAALATIARQQHQIEQYLKRLYSHTSERYCPDQMLFDPLLLASLPDPATPTAHETPPEPPCAWPPRPAPRHRHGRLPIPEHLERVIINLDVEPEQRRCPVTGKPLVLIGYEESEKLEYRPGRLFVNVYRRPKYASPDRLRGNGVGVVTAPLPDHPLPGCKADPGLIAHAIVSKFADHLPFYRQDAIFAREGVDIPRSTLDHWALSAAEVLLPLGAALQRAVLDTEVLFTDDSVIPLLERGRKKTRKARLWVYVRGDPRPRLTAYDFSLDRSQEVPLQYLGDFRGFVHADAYSGYEQLFRRQGVVEVGCWCHARRGFDEAMSSRPQEASEILALVKRLYAFEGQFRELSPEARHLRRQDTTRPIVAAILKRIREMKEAALPCEPLRKALDYVLNQQVALQRFLEDGRLEADNNTAENAIRPVAVGRKNWLFAGSQRGGRAAALYLGLIQSCNACHVNPWAYLDDILRRILSQPVHRLRELLPDQWQPRPRDEHGLLIQR